jgi:hypothetical protein
MSNILNEYRKQVYVDAIEAIDDYGKDFEEFDDLFYQLQLDGSVTGNVSGHRGPFTGAQCARIDRMAHDVLWDSGFIRYCEDICADIADLVERGEETVDVYAACMTLDTLYGELEDYWSENCAPEEGTNE